MSLDECFATEEEVSKFPHVKQGLGCIAFIPVLRMFCVMLAMQEVYLR